MSECNRTSLPGAPCTDTAVLRFVELIKILCRDLDHPRENGFGVVSPYLVHRLDEALSVLESENRMSDKKIIVSSGVGEISYHSAPREEGAEDAVAKALCASELAGESSWAMVNHEQREWYRSQARVSIAAHLNMIRREEESDD